jgi:hypothetical protein
VPDDDDSQDGFDTAGERRWRETPAEERNDEPPASEPTSEPESDEGQPPEGSR